MSRYDACKKELEIINAPTVHASFGTAATITRLGGNSHRLSQESGFLFILQDVLKIDPLFEKKNTAFKCRGWLKMY
jgi:hypothetical protein